MLNVLQKLEILSDAAKYDVSCSSSGGSRKNVNKGLGNSEGMGICHSYTEDGRCVSLLKILLTNFCIFDCSYCITRKSNDVKRTAFTVKEVVDLTISFYRRNYIEGLFLSSGIFKNPDYTMERLVRIAKVLRKEENFHGYIHLKTIPGASVELLKEAGLYADRLSINLELPTEKSLQLLAPEKNFGNIIGPMNVVRDAIEENKDARKNFKNAPVYAQAGQSTQLIIGATEEDDHQILTVAENLYDNKNLKRVYYSGYIPVNEDKKFSGLKHPPIIRENRLYQADWLLRYYSFSSLEIISPSQPFLPLDIDPKLSYALNNLHLFPLDINTADYKMLIRVPGLGLKSAEKIIKARQFSVLNFDHLMRIGVAMNRAKYFLKSTGKMIVNKDLTKDQIKNRILNEERGKGKHVSQMLLF